MTHYRFSDGDSFGFLREHRSCCQRGPALAPPAAPAPRGEGWMEWIGRHGGDKATAIAKQLVGAPLNFIRGVAEGAWSRFPSQEDIADFLRKTETFFREAPASVQRLFKEITNPEYETLLKLTDDLAWVEDFRDLDFEAQREPKPSGVYGPKELLLSRLPKERKSIFLDYVDKYIPLAVQNKALYGAIFAKTTEEPRVRAETMVNNRVIVIDAINRILGKEEPSTPPLKVVDHLAISSLMHHYLDDPKKAVDITNVGTFLIEDFRSSKEQMNLTPAHLAAPKTLADDLGHSRLRGALKMGIVDEALLKGLDEKIRAENAERSRQIMETATKLENLTEATKRKLSKEARTVADIWNGLPGLAKLLLAAAAIFAAAKKPGAAIGLAAVYAIQKFLLKQDSPIEGWAKIAQAPVKFIAEKNKDLLAGIGLAEPDLDIVERSRLMTHFLGDEAHEEVERTAEGFGLLADAPLGSLMGAFKPNEDGITGEFAWKSGDNLDRVLRDRMRKRNFSPSRYRQFFEDEENRRSVADALAHVCYMIAASDSLNKHRSDIVERARKGFGTYDAIDAAAHPDARRYYGEMVQEGWGKAAEMNMTLAEWILSLKKEGRIFVREEEKQPAGVTEDQPTDNAYDATHAANTASGDSVSRRTDTPSVTRPSGNAAVSGGTDQRDRANQAQNPSVTIPANAAPVTHAAGGDSRTGSAGAEQVRNSAGDDATQPHLENGVQRDHAAAGAETNASVRGASNRIPENQTGTPVAGEAARGSSSGGINGHVSSESRDNESPEASRSGVGEAARPAADSANRNTSGAESSRRTADVSSDTHISGESETRSGAEASSRAPQNDSADDAPAESEKNTDAESERSRAPDASQKQSPSETSERASAEAAKKSDAGAAKRRESR